MESKGSPEMNNVAPKQKEDTRTFQLRQLQSYAGKGSRGKQFALVGLKQQLHPQPRSPKPVQWMPTTPLNDTKNHPRQDRELRDSVEDDEPDWMKVKKSPSPKRKLVLDPVDFTVNKRREVEKPREAERRSPVFNGLKNIGNSCYMNAVLQALSSLSSFRADMQRPRLVTAKMPENGVYRALQHVLREMEVSESNKAVSPATLKSSIMKNSVRFQGMFQQDAHEFFCDLLDQVQNEVYLYHDKYRLKLETPKLRLSETDCPTTKNFSCIVQHDLECNNCGHSSTVEELFRHFSLDIKNESSDLMKPPNISELLQQFFKEEVYEKTCENCGFSNCTVRRVIRRLPRILVLHLKRFCIDETVQQYKKNTGQVGIQGTLTLDFCCSGSTKRPLPLWLEESNGNGLGVGTSLPPSCASTPLSDISNLPHTNMASASFQEAAHKTRSTFEDPFEFEAAEENADLERAVQKSMDDVTKVNSWEADQSISRVEEDEDLQRAVEMSLQEFSGNTGPILEEASRISPEESSSDAQDTSREVPAVIEVDDSSSDDNSSQKVSGLGRYMLQGVVSHLGPMVSFGHFTADILTSNREQWIRYNDSLVHPISESDVFSLKKETEAYLLFYVHEDIIPQPATPEPKELPIDRPLSVKQYARRNRIL